MYYTRIPILTVGKKIHRAENPFEIPELVSRIITQ